MLAALGPLFAIATFAYFLPQIADYRDVWGELKDLNWPAMLGLAGATILNLATFAPPWQVVLPGLRFRDALALSQVSTALSIVVPGGAAVGIAGSYAVLRRWGFRTREISRAVALFSVSNQFANLSYPVIAVFLLTRVRRRVGASGDSGFRRRRDSCRRGCGSRARSGQRPDGDQIGDLTAKAVNRVRGRFGRASVGWGGESFEAFRQDAADLLRRRWHVLALATYAGSLTVFLLLLLSLRACGVPGSDVSVVEAFAAWSLARLLGSFPITPGGIGIVELGLTGALVGFGGHNTGVVAAVLVFRFLTMAPTLILGLLAASTVRRLATACPAPVRELLRRRELREAPGPKDIVVQHLHHGGRGYGHERSRDSEQRTPDQHRDEDDERMDVELIALDDGRDHDSPSGSRSRRKPRR